MAKTMSREATSSSSNGSKKERKKQARREAKTMLRLAQAKKDEQKAGKKVAKAQAQLEACRTQIHNIEGKLEEMRNAGHQSEVEAPDTGFDWQGGQPETEESSQRDADYSMDTSTPTSTSTDQVTSLPPAEGRTDIDPAGQEGASPEMENAQADSGSENEDGTD
ncbi:MAG TPA: hypothetical protein VK140_00560 [Ktedonobacteraceae bacterium]|nr:hypothetical protein [Ktedonobacteraceae bacterium]